MCFVHCTTVKIKSASPGIPLPPSFYGEKHQEKVLIILHWASIYYHLTSNINIVPYLLYHVAIYLSIHIVKSFNYTFFMALTFLKCSLGGKAWLLNNSGCESLLECLWAGHLGRCVISWRFSSQSHKMWVTMHRGAVRTECSKVLGRTWKDR